MEQQQQVYKSGLKVNNSLNPKTLEELVPMTGRQLKIYNCGPTVYDSSHMGHARTYLSVDMMRRVLVKYFNYDVFFCMNITDIDDKIIARSNEVGEEFTAFAKKWENDYWEDMKSLGVSLPDSIVRVSEHVPEICAFIQQIIDNGYAYAVNGSVYFDVEKFKEAPNHFYAKLVPSKARNEEDENEDKVPNPDKKSVRDFALWKKAKVGEPKWPSQWGEGRPGWHIECSAMADFVLGNPIDIHMGGVDLKFPHHDNEIAQSEAYYNKPTREENQWVNYFIHAGHLNIDGLKMSKSLKNFITIKNLLKHFTPRQIRLIFLMHSYDGLMDYKPHVEDKNGKITEINSMGEAVEKDNRYTNFFRTVQAISRTINITQNQKWEEKEQNLNNQLIQAKANIHAHFINNFNTQGVITELDILITQVNTYMSVKQPKLTLLEKVYNYTKFIFEVIGLDFEERTAGSSAEQAFLKEVDQVTKYRDQVRDFGFNGKQFDQIAQLSEQTLVEFQINQSQAKDVIIDYVKGTLQAAQDKNFGKIMELSDLFRDEQMIEFGIKIEDRAGDTSLWKQEDKEVLLKELQSKKEQKERLRKQKEEKARKAEEEMKQNPKEMFLQDKKYSKFDENGIPTHDAKGEQLSAKNRKFAEKQYQKQLEKYEKYMSQQQQQQQQQQ